MAAMVPDTEMIMNPVLGHTEPDVAGLILNTGYLRFTSGTGIDGLAKENGDRLDILAVHAETPGTGQFREFMKLAQEQYNTICVWEIWNENLLAALLRYGFTPEEEMDGRTNEKMVGVRWDRK